MPSDVRRGRPPKAKEDKQDQRVKVLLTRAQIEKLDRLRGTSSRSGWFGRQLDEK